MNCLSVILTLLIMISIFAHAQSAELLYFTVWYSTQNLFFPFVDPWLRHKYVKIQLYSRDVCFTCDIVNHFYTLLNYILTYNSKIATSLKCTLDLKIYKITRVNDNE